MNQKVNDWKNPYWQQERVVDWGGAELKSASQIGEVLVKTVDDELGVERGVWHAIDDKMDDLEAREEFNEEGRSGESGRSNWKLSEEFWRRWELHCLEVAVWELKEKKFAKSFNLREILDWKVILDE